jgi:hypothetical protein
MPSPPAITDSNPQTAVFPNAVAYDIDLMVATNRALSTLINAIDSIQTQIDVVDGTKFSPPCLIQIDTEVIRVGSKNGNSLFYCTRGFSNTANASHGQNADVKGYVLSYHHNQVAAEIKAIEAGLGPNFDNVVMQTDYAGGTDIGGVFSNLYLRHNGVTSGTYGGFNTDILVSVDQTGRITQISNSPGNINYPIIYKAGIVQGSNVILGFAFGENNAPNPIIVSEPSGMLYGACQFQSGNDYWVQDHFYLPDDWQGDKISLVVYWRWNPTTAHDNTGTVCWGVRVGGLRASVDPLTGLNVPSSGNGPDISWGNFHWVTDVVPTNDLETAKSKIYLGNPPTGIEPGDEMFFQFARGSSGGATVFNPATPGDTAVGNAELISIKFNLNRNFAMAQE